MITLICSGFHAPKLTDSFLSSLRIEAVNSSSLLVFPSTQYPPFSACHLFNFLAKNIPKDVPVTFISFSAGVVGAIGAAWMWVLTGGKVSALFALDGWGVFLGGNFPIYRLSHDEFTHRTSILLGGGDDCFYAEPPVEHLYLWSHPNLVKGWGINAQGRWRTNAAAFIAEKFPAPIPPSLPISPY